MNKVYWSLW